MKIYDNIFDEKAQNRVVIAYKNVKSGGYDFAQTMTRRSYRPGPFLGGLRRSEAPRKEREREQKSGKWSDTRREGGEWSPATFDTGLALQKCRVAPHREIYWSRIRRQIVQNFQILIVSALKICKQYLQIALTSEGLRSPDTLPGFRPWTRPLGDFRPQTL